MSAVIRLPGYDQSLSLVDLGLAHPKRILWVIALVAMVFFAAFPLAKIDTNPKNMLPSIVDVRISNDEVERDTSSLFTTDNIPSSEDKLRIRPLVPAKLDKPEAIKQLRTELLNGTLFVDRLTSRTAFYVSRAKGANHTTVAKRISELARTQFSENELDITGDPFARNRFGGDLLHRTSTPLSTTTPLNGLNVELGANVFNCGTDYAVSRAV
jgi:predicted RND superfamily exporter protein